MSRIGKKPIIIPEDVKIELNGNILKAKGPKGEGQISLLDGIEVKIENNFLKVIPKEEFLKKEKKASALWGTTRALINNVIKGVKEGFQKQLEINGLGYKAEKEGQRLILKVGYSHPVVLEIPQDINVEIEKNIITVSGISKEKVGQFAALIRKQKPVEPYQGKGIKYVGEYVRRKMGKKIVGSTG
ncbi:MAG: 50S ribosomal protein L6 [Candidatus Paceibacterota bacterium]